MKEHLNVNSYAQSTGWMESHKASESREKYASPQGEALEDTLLTSQDDMFTGTLPVGGFNESSIESMDFEAALESLSFIRRQAGTAEGRQAMSQAHRQITPQKVMELFGVEQRA